MLDDDATLVLEMIADDKWRMGTLALVAELDLPDSWVGAGFVRNAVWDRLHDRPMTPLNDIDVLYCDPERPDEDIDTQLEMELMARSPKRPWSVLNVARKGYRSVAAAMGDWPETATAVAVRLDVGDTLLLQAPFGLEDLLGMIVRPTKPKMAETARARAEKKRWAKLYPNLEFLLDDD